MQKLLRLHVAKMSKRCSYIYCNSKDEPSSKLSHHKFPSDAKLLQKWVDAMGVDNFVPKSHHRLCSAHFEPSMFYGGRAERTRLRYEAVPTIFEAPAKRVQSPLQGEQCGPGQEAGGPFVLLWLPQPGLQGHASVAAGPSGAATAVVSPGPPPEEASPEPIIETQVDASRAMAMHTYSSRRSAGGEDRPSLLAHTAAHGETGDQQHPFIRVSSVSGAVQDDTEDTDSLGASLSSDPMDVADTSPSTSAGARENSASSSGQDGDSIVIMEVSQASPCSTDGEHARSSNWNWARKFTDRSREDSPEKDFLRRAAQQYSVMYNTSRKKVKSLQQSQRRLQRKVAELKAIITELELQRYRNSV